MACMRILAIDPGPELSAFILMDGSRIMNRGQIVNTSMRYNLAGVWRDARTTLAVEMIASYGMPVGREVFETCVWIGRFVERWEGSAEYVYRKDVKMHLCGSMKAKDANIRQALIDRFGGKEKAIGTKKSPGPLYGIKGDEWAALAVAVTYADTR